MFTLVNDSLVWHQLLVKHVYFQCHSMDDPYIVQYHGCSRRGIGFRRLVHTQVYYDPAGTVRCGVGTTFLHFAIHSFFMCFRSGVHRETELYLYALMCDPVIIVSLEVIFSNLKHKDNHASLCNCSGIYHSSYSSCDSDESILDICVILYIPIRRGLCYMIKSLVYFSIGHCIVICCYKFCQTIIYVIHLGYHISKYRFRFILCLLLIDTFFIWYFRRMVENVEGSIQLHQIHTAQTTPIVSGARPVSRQRDNKRLLLVEKTVCSGRTKSKHACRGAAYSHLLRWCCMIFDAVVYITIVPMLYVEKFLIFFFDLTFFDIHYFGFMPLFDISIHTCDVIFHSILIICLICNPCTPARVEYSQTTWKIHCD